MPKAIYHPKIGNSTLIIEAEIYHKGGSKFFALVQSTAKPTYTKSWPPQFVEFKSTPVRGKKSKLHHYILWGNSPEFEQMGITHLITDKGNAVRGGKPMKAFFEHIRSSEFMTFINKTKQ